MNDPFVRLSALMVRRPWVVVGIWVLLLAVFGGVRGSRVNGVVKVGGSSAPGSESVQAAAILQRNFGISARTIVVIYHAPTLTAGDAGFRRLVQAGSRRLAVVRGVRSIRDFPGSGDRSLVSGDGHTTLALVNLAGDEEQTS